ncbi:MAG: hypothetical protein LBO06_02065 [Bacteroidales bacterium]|jgi:hypothetical protein|nr:hypothetical protein [Bacteroidales bacterium]
MKRISIFFIVLISVSCTQKEQVYDFSKDGREMYNESLSTFPASIVSHFPQWNRVNVISVSSNISKHNMASTISKLPTYLFLNTLCKTKNDYYNIKSKIEKEVKHIINVLDTNYILALEMPTIWKDYAPTYVNYDDSVFEKELIGRNINKVSNIVLPIFDDSGTTPTKLPEDYKIYCIDSKSGLFLDKTYYYIDTTNDIKVIPVMPEMLKHGYSRGYALSDKQQRIVYWVVVW